MLFLLISKITPSKSRKTCKANPAGEKQVILLKGWYQSCSTLHMFTQCSKQLANCMENTNAYDNITKFHVVLQKTYHKLSELHLSQMSQL